MKRTMICIQFQRNKCDGYHSLQYMLYMGIDCHEPNLKWIPLVVVQGAVHLIRQQFRLYLTNKLLLSESFPSHDIIS